MAVNIETLIISLVAGSGAGAFGGLVFKAADSYISEAIKHFFESRKLKEKSIGELLLDVVEVYNEGESSGWQETPGSTRHILFIANLLEYHGRDDVAGILRDYLEKWVDCAYHCKNSPLFDSGEFAVQSDERDFISKKVVLQKLHKTLKKKIKKKSR